MNTSSPEISNILSEKDDITAVMSSFSESMLEISGDDVFKQTPEKVHTTIKVETHNHPTGISPYEGAPSYGEMPVGWLCVSTLIVV